jgi:glycosyltransferase involved in cell wall biosynthesis
MTALRTTELVALRQRMFRALVAEVDVIVVLCDWSRDLLVRNGVPPGRIVLSRHGLPETGPDEGRGPRRGPDDGRLRLAYLGRLDPVKGPDLLVAAVRALPRAAVELDLYGISQGAGEEAYGRRLRALAAGDRRIAFHDPVPNDRVVAVLREHDALGVPSRGLETGPLVVLEAFAAGIPVVGSALGGIAELVRDGIDGLLVPAPTVEAWRAALARLCAEPALLPRLRAGVRPPRTMDAVAAEMATLYRALAGSRAQAVACS